MLTHKETIKELVESLETLSDNDLQFVSRIVRALGKPEIPESNSSFDKWALAVAKRNRFHHLTEEQVAEIVHEYRHDG